ncbi:MAG: hypothetical protein PF961_20330 [Planctomycetota bacterium]|nr:hypothetical protein [Planctomycetota bacterium]
MLLDLDYPCDGYDVWMFAPIMERMVLKGYIGPPQQIEHSGNRLLHLIAGGVQWIVRLDSNGETLSPPPLEIERSYQLPALDAMKAPTLLGLFGIEMEKLSHRRVHGKHHAVYSGDKELGMAADVLIEPTVDDDGYVYTDFTISVDGVDPLSVSLAERLSVYDIERHEYVIQGTCMKAGYHLAAGNFTILGGRVVHQLPKDP